MKYHDSRISQRSTPCNAFHTLTTSSCVKRPPKTDLIHRRYFSGYAEIQTFEARLQ